MADALKFAITWLPLALVALIPAAVLLRRIGFSMWWAIPFSLLIIPGLWVLAFVKWPIADARGRSAS